jgi:CDP-diacylglycerol pyrophosphatase
LPRPRRRWWGILLAALLLGGCATRSQGNRDVLWQIVSQCVDISRADYCATCRSPVVGSCPDQECRRTTEVWAQTADYVAIRDIKMCGCQNRGFVHGLALPRFRVTGVEDRARPPGIWAFAWDVARTRIDNEREIALVVNPPGLERTQDQLHVHLVRLAPGARARLADLSPARTARLDAVWDAAARHARSRTEYGVLVAREDAGAGFIVVTDPTSPEEQFTIPVCP